MDAFSTFRILPRIGRIAWILPVHCAVLAEPPAESPSTIKISHISTDPVSRSLPALPLRIKRIFLLGQHIRLGLLLRFCGFWQTCSAQAITFFSTSRLRSKYSWNLLAASLFRRPLPHPGCPASSLSGPRNRGSGCLIEITAVMPFRISDPVKLLSFSFKIPSSLA